MIRAQVTNRQWGWLPRVTLSDGSGTLILGRGGAKPPLPALGGAQAGGPVGPGLPADYRYYQYRGAKQMVSLYAHALVDLTPALKLMLDLQYAFNRYRLYDELFLGNDFSVPYHFVNPRAGVNFNIDDRWSAYTTAAVTSREPRLKNLYDAAEASTPASWGSVVPQFAVRPDGSIDFSESARQGRIAA